MDVKKRQPEVLVFQDTSSRKPRKRIKIQEKVQVPQEITVYEQRKQKIEEDGLDFRETMNEMRALATKSLMHDKKNEKDLLLSLGAKAPPRNKIPYARYLNVIKKRKKKGLPVGVEQKVNDDKDLKSDHSSGKTRIKRGKGRWRDSVKSLAPIGNQKIKAVLVSAKNSKTKLKH